MIENKKRIDLLSPVEIEDLYSRPTFNDEERFLYFTLNKEEISSAMNYSNERTRLYFILQLGYFKAKQSNASIHSALMKLQKTLNTLMKFIWIKNP